MQKILKYRYIVLAIWIVITVLFAINQPDLKQIINQRGEATISDSEPSVIASEMLNKMGTSKGDSLLLVFNDENQLSDDAMKDVEDGINHLNENRAQLQITNIIDPFATPEAKDQLISADNTTLIIPVSFEKESRDSQTVIKDFDLALEDVAVTHYLTGSTAIGNDYVTDVAKGVEKSGAITICFILVVLILMFRSVVTPIVSLLSVGVAYLCSMGIIGILVTRFNFSVTSFTQMFIILVLFGIGTDYHILLFNRFKEELAHGLSIDAAILKSFQTAGKTIFYSGLTVFMGFASLTFVQFPVYRSANAVAIGIGVLLIEMLTLTPLLMKILGKKLFWPSKNTTGHKDSRFWGKAASISVRYPIRSLLLVALVLAPVILFSPTPLSFDNIKDLSPNDPSVQGFNLVADKFGAGQVMQTTIVIENNDAMNNNEDLGVIDDLTEKLKGVEGVKAVAGPTQPKGAMIADLYTNTQTKTVVNGLSATSDGVNKVNDGLGIISSSLVSPDFSPVLELSQGTGSLKNGIDAVTLGLDAIDQGIEAGANGADRLAGGIVQLRDGVSGINGGLTAISSKLGEINDGYVTLGEGYASLATSTEQLNQLTAMMQVNINNLDAKLPNDPDVAALTELTATLSSSLESLNSAMNSANGNYDALTNGLAQVNGGLQTLIDATGTQSPLVMGINDLETGATALSDGLNQGSAGQELVIASMAKLSSGAAEIKTGQESLYGGLTTLSSGMSQLKDGIGQSSSGLTSISDGINKSGNFLTELTSTKSFYIPDEVLNGEDINKMLDPYMSTDRKITKLTVTLASEPYAEDSIALIGTLNTTVQNHLAGTALSDATFGVAGATSSSYDMKNVATHDIVFTQIIVLMAIFILLIGVTKSVRIPIFIVGSLLIAYYTALAATAFISKFLFSSAAAGLSWNVPFFSFVMIAALGVDYSIFLMDRYREYPELPPKEAIVLAARNIGGVVISAAVILAGTFATLYPSNIVILMELAICVVIGLFLLAFVLLPVVIPALIALTDNLLAKENPVALAVKNKPQ
ncbi:MMPL family transporter [Acetobacterium bakii]|uniref:Membrane protein n=1 Tax=Acetobacterium bakii TaxID=52689 RepID=A0A0L6TZU6_9FIRM|nr:MMPL family transporter [Acetobacterium bakii]KNZ41607.1 membrane protein [Acetobacterium bakii]